MARKGSRSLSRDTIVEVSDRPIGSGQAKGNGQTGNTSKSFNEKIKRVANHLFKFH